MIAEVVLLVLVLVMFKFSMLVCLGSVFQNSV